MRLTSGELVARVAADDVTDFSAQVVVAAAAGATAAAQMNADLAADDVRAARAHQSA